MVATAQQLTSSPKLSDVSKPQRIQNTAKRRSWTKEEEAIIRDNYTNGIAKTLGMLPGRTRSALAQKAEKLKISVGENHRRRWTDDEVQYLQSEWEFGKPSVIASQLDRKTRAVINKADELGLPIGPPDGFDFVTAVAAKMGYEPSTFYRILNFFNIRMLKAPTVPQGKRKRLKRKTKRRFKARHRYVDVMEAEEAVKKWVNETETIPTAALRLNISQHRVNDLLVRAGEKIVIPGKKTSLRIFSKTLDKIVADYQKETQKKKQRAKQLENLDQAAKRYGIWYETLGRWMRNAGFDWDPITRKWELDPKDVDRVVEKNFATSVLARVNGKRINPSKTVYRKFISLLRWKVRRDKTACREFVTLLKVKAHADKLKLREEKQKAK